MKRVHSFLVVFSLFINIHMSMANRPDFEVATLGGGCFWCTEAVYARMKGVESVLPGYSGGSVSNPSYQEVCTGTTGHAEVVQVTFNPAVISYSEILEVFFALHDPTTLNRQGADIGTQYRSVIFYHSPEQKKEAEKMMVHLRAEGTFDAPIVTEVTAFSRFYPAEEYHKNYFARNPSQPYCRMVVAPKVKKMEKVFQEKQK